MIKYICIVPHPFSSDNRRELYADTIPELQANVRNFITEESYGASDIGARFEVAEIDLPSGASASGYITYNGKYVAEEDVVAASHGGDAVILEESI